MVEANTMQILKEIAAMLEKWGITTDDWVLVGDFAYVLNGYNLSSRKVSSKHFDVIIGKSKWPWLREHHLETEWRKVIPPRGEALEEYELLMSEENMSLDLTVVFSNLVNWSHALKTVGSRKIRVLTSLANVKMFFEEVIQKACKLGFDEHKRNQWNSEFRAIFDAAAVAGDLAVASYCKSKLSLV
jgi:hypothetical protein|tara:strand:+ start:92 stop:649 length:558 start_codon:yes stop_codon:yes gene_type:complete